jgi:hypothetical protein
MRVGRHRQLNALTAEVAIFPSPKEAIMRMWFGLAMGAMLLGLAALPAPAVAQEKTAKACREEWQAAKADFQAKGITEKAYVAQCRGGGSTAQPTPAPAAAPAPAPAAATPAGSGKTASACRAEWQANKAANQAASITEKAYIEKCRAGEAVAAPSAPAPSAPAPAPPPPRTAAPAQPPSTPAVKPAATTVAPAPTGANQFATEAQAKSHCPADIVVWVNLKSKKYHFSGYKNYGNTKEGAYRCEKQATGEGFVASKNEKRPGA